MFIIFPYLSYRIFSINKNFLYSNSVKYITKQKKSAGKENMR